MMRHMVPHETRYEIVAVVVTGRLVEGERVIVFLAHSFQQLRSKLTLKKFIIQSLVVQKRLWLLCIADEFDGFVLVPRIAIGSQLSCERTLTPGNLTWSDDGGEGRYTLESARIP